MSKLPYTKKEAKAWAKKHLRGLENIIFPSFSADLKKLDEKGIRHDVKMSIAHGFFSVAIGTDMSLTRDEFKRMCEIVADEAKGKILVSIYPIGDSLEEQIETLQIAEAAGVDSGYTAYPPNYCPSSEEQIFEDTKRMCASTNLAMTLYSTHKWNFEKFHPSQFNPHLLNRMADFENAVALKIGVVFNPGYTFECFRLMGDKILVNDPVETTFPMTVSKFGQKWGGGAPFEGYQTPDDRRMTNYFNFLLEGKYDEAMELYWKMVPVRAVFWELGTPGLIMGHYHYPLLKYLQYLTGGNGGMLRLPVMRLYEHDKMKIKMAMGMSGLKYRDAPDKEFYQGRSVYGSLD